MNENKLPTQFAPAERAKSDVIKNQTENIAGFASFKDIVNTMPNAVMVLNKERQIVYVNNTVLTIFTDRKDVLIGMRPGELLGCIHSAESEGGCGTTEFCRTCGAVRAILNSQNKKTDMQECRITQKTGDALDLRVWASPLDVNGEMFTIFTIMDIKDEKRRRVLERLFFHDILNAAGGIKGILDIMIEEDGLLDDELGLLLPTLADGLIEEINSYKELCAAENNEMSVNFLKLTSTEFLQNVVGLYQNHLVAKDKILKLDDELPRFEFRSDPVVLKRVIGNMIKNALEATRAGGTVMVGCNYKDDRFSIRVNNSGFMTRDLQLQVFQRSFSTKGVDRGLGTYSMKLLSERYLNGTISFTSSPEGGTTFIASYPVSQELKEN